MYLWGFKSKQKYSMHSMHKIISNTPTCKMWITVGLTLFSFFLIIINEIYSDSNGAQWVSYNRYLFVRYNYIDFILMDSTTLSDRQEAVSHIFKEMAEMSLGQFIAELEAKNEEYEYFVKPRKEEIPSVESQIENDLEQELGCFY